MRSLLCLYAVLRGCAPNVQKAMTGRDLVKTITNCRACGSKALTPAFSVPLGASSRRLWRDGEQSFEYLLCDPTRHARACGLLQSAAEGAEKKAAPSGRHSSTREHLRAAATEALELISGRDCAALDIGCNDGALLSYYPRWVERHGVDPGEHIEEIGDWATKVRTAFPSQDFDKAYGDKKFDIITAISVLEHMDDPRRLLSAVKERLTNDGVFVLETLYSPMVLTRNCIDVLQVGVTAVYSLAVIEWLVRDAGLKVFKGALTSKEGGSIRLFITHQKNDEFDFDPWFERLARLWDEENALAMRAIQPYQSFERRVSGVQTALASLLEEIGERGECVHVIGADAHTEALLQWVGPSAKVVTAAVDTAASREHSRIGARALPVISETESRAAEPDFLIAPARYKREMLEKWRESILLGARMIFVTPTPHIVTAANYAGEYGKAIAGGESAGGAESLRAILAAAGRPRLIAENPDRAHSQAS